MKTLTEEIKKLAFKIWDNSRMTDEEYSELRSLADKIQDLNQSDELLKKAYIAGNSNAKMPEDCWETLDEEFNEWMPKRR